MNISRVEVLRIKVLCILAALVIWLMPPNEDPKKVHAGIIDNGEQHYQTLNTKTQTRLQAYKLYNL